MPVSTPFRRRGAHCGELLERRRLLSSAANPDCGCTPPDLGETPIYFDPPGWGDEYSTDFQVASRWTTTASGSAGQTGRGMTLTWSIIPDGTSIPAGSGFPAAPSDLVARMNAIYGSQANWQPIMQQVFTAWSSVTGITYIYEPNDDGVAQSSTNNGVLGVRGDVRIGGHFLDGADGVLAFNQFPPNGGDMVLDTGDLLPGGFMTATGGNSVRLRTVMMHEHGHGLGLAHVCPINGTKLMEPFISTLYNVIPLDDMLGGQRNYGDRFEKLPGNNSAANATDLGSLNIGGANTVGDVSVANTSDIDVYKIQLNAGMALSATLSPVGSTYTQGPQTVDCNTGTPFNPQTQGDLRLELLNADGFILANVNSTSTGSAETLSDFGLPAGIYFARVRLVSGNTQLYQLQLSGSADAVAPSVTSTSFQFEPAHAINFAFSENVQASLTPDDFTVTNLTTSQTVDATGIAYISFTNTAVLTFASPLPDGNYSVLLAASDAADGSGNVLSAAGTLQFFVLAGDANRDRTVNISDFAVLAAHFNLGGTYSQGDFNYSGTVEIGDFSLLASNFNLVLPEARAAGAPAAEPRVVAGNPFASGQIGLASRLEGDDLIKSLLA